MAVKNGERLGHHINDNAWSDANDDEDGNEDNTNEDSITLICTGSFSITRPHNTILRTQICQPVRSDFARSLKQSLTTT